MNVKNFTPEQLLEAISVQCDVLRAQTVRASAELTELNRRLAQIVQQLRKNIEVRDSAFAGDFNGFCQDLRKELDAQDALWQPLRARTRTYQPNDWKAELGLAVKSMNMRAKALSRACDEFTTMYDVFSHTYKNFTAAKLNVWLLTSCQNDLESLTGKILFLAREIAKQTEAKRGENVIG